jgi:hypothetical protein
MTRIGKEMVARQKARWAAHKNASGNEAKPLSKKYVFIKKRIRGGGTQYRDNHLSGVMIENFLLRKAIGKEIRAENTSRIGREHARGQDKYEHMIGFSGPEQSALFKDAKKEYGQYLKSAWIPLSGQTR